MDPPPPLPPNPNPDDSRAAAESWVPPPPSEEPLPQVPGGGKLRLMCSYGGHIVPRPHDKSLCYVGGDTRIVVVERGSTLADLCGRLSKTLLQGRGFTLKYQLPSEDLDSLISVTTDEDLDNMIDEYDRTSSRLRLFLFFLKPETSASMGALLDDAKSETWFVDALNGSGLLPRGLSDSAVDDCLLSLDLESQGDFNKHVAGKTLSARESLHYGFSAPDSPLVDNSNSNDNNNSSFGSSSSSPSMSNLPPIRVRVADDQRPGSSVEEQFAQISFGGGAAAVPQAGNPVPAVSGGDNAGGVGADDERSDHGAAAVGLRKPPLPLQPVQPKSGGYGLPSPDSVASDTSSIASASSLSKPMYYQDQHHHHHPPLRETRGPASPNTTTEAAPDAVPVPVPGTHILQQSNDPGGYLVTPHLDPHHHHHPPQIHQQYVPAGTQYVHQPMQPYYQVYPQTPQQFHHHQHHPIDQQYYVMSYATADPAIPTSRPGPASAGIPPVYPAKAASPAPTPGPAPAALCGLLPDLPPPPVSVGHGHFFFGGAELRIRVFKSHSVSRAVFLRYSDAISVPIDDSGGRDCLVRGREAVTDG